MVTENSSRRFGSRSWSALDSCWLRCWRSARAGPRLPSRKRADPQPTIVLVHGDWADASSWTSVIERLQERGFTVLAPPNPLRGPAADAPYLASYLRRSRARSCSSLTRTAGSSSRTPPLVTPNIKALVYIDGFMPDEGEIARRPRRLARAPASVRVPSMPFRTRAAWICTCAGKRTHRTRASTSASPTGQAARRPPFSPPSNGPRPLPQFSEPSGPPAWKTIPSWSLIGTLDHVIPPTLQEDDVESCRRSHHQD